MTGSATRGLALREIVPSSVGWAFGAALAAIAAGALIAVAPLLGTGLVVGVAGIVFLCARPEWLPPLLVLAVFLDSVNVGGQTMARLVAPVALVVVLVHLPERRSPGRADRRTLAAVGLYVLWAAASVLWSLSRDQRPVASDVGGTFGYLFSLAIGLVYMFATAVLVERERDLSRLQAAMWIGAVVSGIAGIAAFLASAERSAGFRSDPNLFAALQLIALPFMTALAVGVRDPLKRIGLWVGVFVVVASIVTSLSRGGLIGLGALLVALVVARPGLLLASRQYGALLGVLAVLGLALVIASPVGNAGGGGASLASRLTSSDDGSSSAGSGRTYLWHAAWLAFRSHPVLGIGYGSFQPTSNLWLQRSPATDFRVYRLRPDGQPTHNTYLGTLAELGLVGLSLLIAMLGSAVASARRSARRARTLGAVAFERGAWAVLAAFVTFMTTAVFLTAELQRSLWLLIGISLALSAITRPPVPRQADDHHA